MKCNELDLVSQLLLAGIIGRKLQLSFKCSLSKDKMNNLELILTQNCKFMVKVLQTSRFKRDKLVSLKLDDGPPLSLPNITPWMHKHACAPHITPSPGGPAWLQCRTVTPIRGDGGLLCHANTNRFLSYSNVCPHSFSSPSLSLNPYPASPSTPDCRLLSASPSLSSPSKSALREEGASRPGAAEAGLSPGGQPVSRCMGLFPGPTKTISYSNVTIRPLTHRGLFMAAAPGRRVKMVI